MFFRFFDRVFGLRNHKEHNGYIFDRDYKYYDEPIVRRDRRRVRKSSFFGLFTRRLIGIPIWCILLAFGLFHFVPSVKAFFNSIFKRK